jgi:hypothetical protein
MAQTTIPDGYTLKLVDPNGTIIDTIEIGGIDLAKPFGAAELVDEVKRALHINRVVG